METCSVANPEGDKVMRECISSLAGLYHEYTIVMFADIVGVLCLFVDCSFESGRQDDRWRTLAGLGCTITRAAMSSFC